MQELIHYRQTLFKPESDEDCEELDCEICMYDRLSMECPYFAVPHWSDTESTSVI